MKLINLRVTRDIINTNIVLKSNTTLESSNNNNIHLTKDSRHLSHIKKMHGHYWIINIVSGYTNTSEEMKNYAKIYN